MKKPLFSALILVLFINGENGHGIFEGYSNTWECIPLN